MESQTMGQTIAKLRKEQGMTQKDLAERMHVTDKAVSKWERDLSCPDIASLPQLAQELNISVETLMNISNPTPSSPVRTVTDTILSVIPLAMGTAVTALSALKTLDVQTGITLLGIGMFCTGLSQLRRH